MRVVPVQNLKFQFLWRDQNIGHGPFFLNIRKWNLSEGSTIWSTVPNLPSCLCFLTGKGFLFSFHLGNGKGNSGKLVMTSSGQWNESRSHNIRLNSSLDQGQMEHVFVARLWSWSCIWGQRRIQTNLVLFEMDDKSKIMWFRSKTWLCASFGRMAVNNGGKMAIKFSCWETC